MEQTHLSLILHKLDGHAVREICLRGSKSSLTTMHIHHAAEFQKYNTSVRFIGFQPIRACIIDQLSNLDASSI
jgi:hypothetical protein